MIPVTEDDLRTYLDTWRDGPRREKLYSVQLSYHRDPDAGLLFTHNVSFYGEYLTCYYPNAYSCQYLYATNRGFVLLHESLNYPNVYEFGRKTLKELVRWCPELLHNLFAPKEEKLRDYDPNAWLEQTR